MSPQPSSERASDLRTRFFTVLDRRRWRDLLRDRDDPRRTAMSFGLGAVVGATPVLGLHTWGSVTLAALLRLPPLAAVLGSNLSNPVTFVPITLLEIRVGQWMLGQPWHPLPPEITPVELGRYVLAAWLGFLVVGPALGALAQAVLWGILRASGRHRRVPAAARDRAEAAASASGPEDETGSSVR